MLKAVSAIDTAAGRFYTALRITADTVEQVRVIPVASPSRRAKQYLASCVARSKAGITRIIGGGQSFTGSISPAPPSIWILRRRRASTWPTWLTSDEYCSYSTALRPAFDAS